MKFQLQDILEASSEVFSELLLTSILVLILIGLGIILGLWSRRRHYRAHRDRTERIGLRRRFRQPERYEADNDEGGWFTEFLQGISTEMVGAVITTLLFGIIMLIFQQYQATQKRQGELFLQMGSPVNVFAVEAARLISAEGWLYDGSMQGINLSESNLRSADLERADLHNVDFTSANLQSANLSHVNLQDTRLVNAILKEANLNDADLQNSRLFQANLEAANLSQADLSVADLSFAILLNIDLRRAQLQDANLRGANVQGGDLELADLMGANLSLAKFQGANLRNANLLGANLNFTAFDSQVVLPDARSIGRDNNNNFIYDNYWSAETDMSRFTDSEHPNFWDPCQELITLPWYCEAGQ
jgi:uncharacterized protein YjbI with pentapeptide repeats